MEELQNSLKTLTEDCRKRYDELSNGTDYSVCDILKIYPHKGLVNVCQKIFNLSGDGYKNIVYKLLKEGNSDLINAMNKYIPQIKID